MAYEPLRHVGHHRPESRRGADADEQVHQRERGAGQEPAPHHVQALLGAFDFLGALRRGLDLGAPPFDPLSGKRR